MNQSANESLMALFASAGLPLIALIVVFCLGIFLITGYSMKFALSAAGVGRFGFWKSIGIVVLTTIATMIFSVIAALTLGENPILMLFAGLFTIVVYAMVIALIGKCGIGRGLKTYFYNGVFGTIGMVVFMIGFAGVAMVAAPIMGLDQEALTRLKESMPKQDQFASESSSESFENRFGSLTNVSFPTKDNEASDSSEELPSTTQSQFAAPVHPSDDEIQDVFYQPVPTKVSETGHENSSNNTFKGVQANPFVK